MSIQYDFHMNLIQVLVIIQILFNLLTFFIAFYGFHCDCIMSLQIQSNLQPFNIREVFRVFCQDSVRILLGFCQDSVRILLGFCQDSVRILLRFCQDSVRILLGFCQDSVRILLGFCQDSVRILLGFCCDVVVMLWKDVLLGFGQNSVCVCR